MCWIFFEFSQEVKEDFYCPAFKDILFKPVETLCKHYFCGECFKQALQSSGFPLNCPCMQDRAKLSRPHKKASTNGSEAYRRTHGKSKLILQSPTLPLTQQLTPLQPLWSKQWNSFTRERFPPNWSAWVLCS